MQFLSPSPPPHPSPYLSGWKWEEELSIKSARSSQSGVDGINSISGSNDDDLPSAVQAIHEGKQRRYDGRVDLVLTAGTNRGQSIDLIKEYDGGTQLICLEGMNVINSSTALMITCRLLFQFAWNFNFKSKQHIAKCKYSVSNLLLFTYKLYNK